MSSLRLTTFKRILAIAAMASLLVFIGNHTKVVSTATFAPPSSANHHGTPGSSTPSSEAPPECNRFLAVPDVPLFGTPDNIAVGDFDEDGIQDVATANFQTRSMSVRFGDGSGGFSGGADFPTGNHTNDVAVADFNNDANKDIVVATADGIRVFLGDGTGAFPSQTFTFTPGGPLAVATSDFNNDGKEDVVTGNNAGGSISVFIGNGAGAFSSTPMFVTGTNLFGVAVGDLNLDGNLDVVTANFAANSISALLGNGGGGFSSPTHYSMGTNPAGVALGDLNHDGKLDAVSANYSAGSVSVRLGTGSGSFLGQVTFTTDAETRSVTLRDMNGDGHIDILTPHINRSTVSFLLGDGSGNFSAFEIYPMGGKATRVALGDFNSDGRLDFVTSNHTSNNLSVRLGDDCLDSTCASQPPGLISWWRGEGNALDSVGPNHGTLQGGTTFTAGKIGQGFHLHNYFTDGVRVGSQVYEMESGTVSAWFNWDGQATPGWFSPLVILGSTQGGETSSPMPFIFHGTLWWQFSSTIYYGGRYNTGIPVVPGRWYHIAMTYYDNTANDNSYIVRLYVDGVQVDASNLNDPGDFRDEFKFGDAAGYDPGVTGIIDEVQIYNRALSGCEVQNLYNAAIGLPCAVCDSIAPTTTAETNSNANNEGWNNSDVGVSLSATDDVGGSGVSQITYSAIGAQTIPATTVNGASINLTITAEGETTITYSAVDSVGNTEAAQTLIIKMDRTAPGISCGSADGAWHATDVSIACTANDTVSGLANSGDGSFNLTTNVPANSETANASTDSRNVCDVAGNCATAGPISGNKVDKKAPDISITSPAAGADYVLNQSVAASYSCGDGGSGVGGCAGPVASGSDIDTSPAGPKTFTVTATDSVGNSSSQTVTYSVHLPQLSLLGPAQVWLGLKNSDDVGTKFDLLAEVLKNGAVIGSGQLNDLPGGSSGFNNAALRTINMALPATVGVGPGDTLSLRLSVRIAASSGHVGGTARLWFNDAAASSRFSTTIEGVTNNNYLLNGFLLGRNPGPGPKKTADVFVHRNQGGNPFKPFGTWNFTF